MDIYIYTHMCLYIHISICMCIYVCVCNIYSTFYFLIYILYIPHLLNQVVFVSPFEHHSVLLQWRESGVTIVRCAQTESGRMDLKDLEMQIKVKKDLSKLKGF